MRILFFGDSITQGFWSVDGGWVERIRKHYDALALQDLSHNRSPEIFNLGISGDTTRDLLARVEQETKTRVLPGDPVIAVVAIGTNDDLFEHNRQWVPPEEFLRNLYEIIAVLRPLTHDILLVGNPACDESKTTPVSWGDYHYTNAELQRSEAAIQQTAADQQLTFVPIFEAFKTKLGAGEDLLADGLHPNDAGHQLMADAVLPALKNLVDSLNSR